MVSKGLHSTTYPPIDPEIGQPGVVHEANIERSAYSLSETKLIATNRIRLKGGYRTTRGDKLKGRIGFTQQEAAEKARISGLFSQVIDYRYNIRGWLTRINNADVSTVADGNNTYDYFGMQLAYNDATGGLSTAPAYNGNISAIKWSKGAGGPVVSQAYTFAYDAMNRLKDAYHFDYKTSTASWLSNNNGFGESQTYDLNGNIKTLVRKGYMGSNLDNLSYSYTGNQLNYVNDTGDANNGFVNLNAGADDYAYDANGNLYKDKNKGIVNNGDIRYNHLNLAKKVIKGKESINYIYDATGRKLAQEVYSKNDSVLVKRTDYIGELVYEGTPGTLQFIQHSEGRVVKDGSGWEYQYHLKDHLGNIRVSFTTKPQVAANYTANMEAGQYGSGETDFDKYNSYVNNAMDHTDAGFVYERIHELNGGYQGRVGMTKSMVVMPGDEISASVYAKYSNLTENANSNPFLADLAWAFNVSSGSVGEQLKLYNGLSSFAALVPLGDHLNDDDSAPKAFITILLFDNNYNLLDATWDQVSTTGATSHDLLSVSIKAQEPGFAYFFLSNEHPYDVRVYFDDLTLTHTPSLIFSASDYYPFGLTFNSYQRDSGVNQKFQYNGIEKVDDLDLGVSQSFFRMHDPSLGRWWQLDPKPREDVSLYSAMGNNPILYSDPLGDTTRIYNIRGKFLYSIDVAEEENQAHFVSGAYEKRVQGKNESNAAYSKRVRNASVAFIGANTAKDLKEIADAAGKLANGEGRELGFVGYISDTKEIRIDKLPTDENTKYSGTNVQAQVDKKYGHEGQTGLFLFGHVHHKGFLRQNSNADLGQPSGRLGSGYYPDYRQTLRDGNGITRPSPVMIATPTGYTLYPSIGYKSTDDPNPSDESREKYSYFKSKKR